MGSKSWLPIGVLLVGGTLLCGCNDPQKTNKSVMPPPQYPAGPYNNPNSNVMQPGVGGMQPGTSTGTTIKSTSSAVPAGSQPWGSPASSWNSNGPNSTTGPGAAPPFSPNTSSGLGGSSGLGTPPSTGYNPGTSSPNLGSSGSTNFANMPPPATGGPAAPPVPFTPH